MSKVKRNIILNIATVLSFAIIFIFSGKVNTYASTVDNDAQSVVTKAIDAQCKLDVSSYISCFTSNNQNEMISYIQENGQSDFFKETSVGLLNITKLTNEVGEKTSHMSEDELALYDQYSYYYVELNNVFDEQKVESAPNSDSVMFEDGISYKIYVLAFENSQWKIMRVSTPDISIIKDSEEGFNTINEEKASIEQQKNMKVMNSNSEVSLLSLSYPSTITVYFTKSTNINHFGSTSYTLGFSHYLKNVIPNEWTVSYYGSYPAYLRAGTMASKMYAWYYSVNPKWNYAPYYADVKDNSSDQNYLYGSYSDLASYYQDYVDSAISDVQGIAMVNYNSALFEVHYHATSGSYHSGQMSASGALSKAKEGSTYKAILHYYYDSSTYSGNEVVKFISY